MEKILSLRTQGSPVNRNINKVENYGIELATACQLNSHLGLNMNYSYLHMKYPVPAAPEHQLYLGGRYARSNWSVATGLQYINGILLWVVQPLKTTCCGTFVSPIPPLK